MILDMLELEELMNKKNVKILEIGSGTGYVIALLSEMLSNAKIYGLEIKSSLAKGSQKILKDNKRVKIMNKSGFNGYKKEAPYDRILISASAPNKKVIINLISQLKDEGLLGSPVGYDLIKIRKKGKKITKEEMKNKVMFVPLINE